jgi:hypothetical protein
VLIHLLQSNRADVFPVLDCFAAATVDKNQVENRHQLSDFVVPQEIDEVKR